MPLALTLSAVSAPEWLCLHLPLHGSAYGVAGDAAIKHVFEPALWHLTSHVGVRNAYFVRYADFRWHLRMRFAVEPRDACMAMSALTECVLAPMQDGLRPDDARNDSRVWYSLPRHERVIQWRSYSPEVQRFGGMAAMPCIERLFTASSLMAGHALDSIGELPREVRLGRALLVALVTAYRYFECPRCTATLLRGMTMRTHPRIGEPQPAHLGDVSGKASLGDQVADVLQQLANDVVAPFGDVPDSLLRTAFADLHALTAEGRVIFHRVACTNVWAVASMLLPSVLHMCFNRMGVQPNEERELVAGLRSGVPSTAVCSYRCALRSGGAVV